MFVKEMSDLAKFKAEFFRALAHPLRIRIVDELRGGEISVNDLCARLGVEQSTLSQQLALTFIIPFPMRQSSGSWMSQSRFLTITSSAFKTCCPNSRFCPENVDKGPRVTFESMDRPRPASPDLTMFAHANVEYAFH